MPPTTSSRIATGKPDLHSLPVPSGEAQAQSKRLVKRLSEKLTNHNSITLGEFMHSALYEPELGYYAAGTRKFGEAGDFVTAPEMGFVFARCLARGVARVITQCQDATVLELGAGSGQLAYDLLLELEQLQALPARYQILEVSAHLKARQEDLLATLPESITTHIEWLCVPPTTSFEGVVFGNEVIDALPVERFTWDDGAVLIDTVSMVAGELELGRQKASDHMRHSIEKLLEDVGPWPSPYTSEVRLGLSDWLGSVTQSLSRGAVLFIDYGTDAHDYYRHERSDGTLLCHYQHRAHEDILLWPGLQDITAWVDFTAVADAALEHGLNLDGYTTQTHFLLDLDLDEVVTRAYEGASDRQKLRLASQTKQLTLPGEMGERFKAIAFCRGLERGILSPTHTRLERHL